MLYETVKKIGVFHRFPEIQVAENQKFSGLN